MPKDTRVQKISEHAPCPTQPGAGKLRIVHVIESLGIGGAERRLVSDLRWLDRERCEHRVVYLLGADALRAEIEELGIEVHGLNMRSLRDWQTGVFGLLRLLRAWKPAVVHTQVFGADVYGRLASALAGIPAVCSTIQTMPYEPLLARFYSTKRRWADQLTARFLTQQFLAVSEAVRDGLIRGCGIRPAQIRVIPNGVDMTRFTPRPSARAQVRASLGLAETETVLLAVGRLIPDKDHVTLVRATASLVRTCGPVRVLLVGDGPERGELERVVEGAGLRDHVRLLGTRSDVEQFYQAADVFVSCSLREGLPVSLLEAMAAEVPVVATAIPAHREVLGSEHSPWMTPIQEPDQVAEAVSRVLHDRPGAQARARQLREGVVPRFSAQIFARQLQAFYDEWCGSRASPSVDGAARLEVGRLEKASANG